MTNGKIFSIADKLIAHRGWQSQYPENTRLSVEHAIRAGAKHIEIDIQLTCDYIPIVYHDADLLRLSGTSAYIHEITFAEASKQRAYEPGRFADKFHESYIFSLQECVDLFRQQSDITLYVEIKRNPIRQFGIQQVLDSILPLLEDIKSHCVCISFDLPVLQEAKSRGWNNVGYILNHWDEVDNKQLLELHSNPTFCDAALIPDGFEIRSLSFPLAVYEIDNYKYARTLLEKGVKLIETFSIGEMIEQDQAENKEN